MQFTPLYPIYQKYQAKVVDFHGWALPVQFSSIIQEHRAVHLGDAFDGVGAVVRIGDATAVAVGLQRIFTDHRFTRMRWMTLRGHL